MVALEINKLGNGVNRISPGTAATTSVLHVGSFFSKQSENNNNNNTIVFYSDVYAMSHTASQE